MKISLRTFTATFVAILILSGQLSAQQNPLIPIKKNGKWGFADTTNKVIISCVYDDTDRYFSEGFTAVKKGQNWAVIDASGKAITPFKYSNIEHFKEGMAKVSVGEKFGFINTKGQEIVSLKYEAVDNFKHSLASVKSNGKWGMVDKNGKELVLPEYDDIYEFTDSIALVKKNGKWGYMNTNGELVVSCKFDRAEQFRSNGEAKVITDGKLGLIDKKGNFVLDPKYDFIEFGDEHSKVGLNGKVGLIDKEGNMIINAIYDDMQIFWNYITVKLNGKAGVCNLKGEMLIECQYDDVRLHTYGYFSAKSVDGWALFDSTQTAITPFKYDFPIEIWYLDQSYFVTSGGKMGLFNLKDKKEQIKPNYDGLRTFFEIDGSMTYYATNNDECGIIDSQGKILIPIEYERIETYYINRTYGVFKNNMKGLYNLDKGLVVDCKYDYISSTYRSDYDYVVKDGKYGFFDEKTFEMVVPCEFDSYYYQEWYRAFLLNKDDKCGLFKEGEGWLIEPSFDSIYFTEFENLFYPEEGGLFGVHDFLTGLVLPCEFNTSDYSLKRDFILSKNNKFGVYTSDGKMTMDFIYENISWVNDNLINVTKDGKVGLFTLNGEQLLPYKYDHIYSAKNVVSYWPEGTNYLLICIQEGLDGDGYPIYKKGLYETFKKQIIFEPKYEEIYIYGDVFIVRKDNKWALAGVGRPEQFLYDDMYPIEGSAEIEFVKVFQNDKYGIINIKGETIIAPEYDEINIIADNYYLAVKGSDKSLFNQKTGTKTDLKDWAIEFLRFQKSEKYELKESCDYFLITDSENRKAILTLNGQMSDFYESISLFPGDFYYLPIMKDNLWGFVDIRTGKVKIPCMYTSAESFKVIDFSFQNEPFAEVIDGSRYIKIDTLQRQYFDSNIQIISEGKLFGLGIIDSENEEGKENIRIIIEPQYEDIISNEDINHWFVKKNGKYGLIDSRNLAIIPFEYDYLNLDWNFEDEYLALVKAVKGSKVGLFNIFGKQLVPCEFDKVGYDGEISSIEEGAIRVTKGKLNGTYSHDGRLLIPCEYNDFYVALGATLNYIVLLKDGKMGGLTENFKPLFPVKYDYVSPEFYDVINIMSNKLWGFVNPVDTIIVEPQFTSLGDDAENMIPVGKDKKCGYIDYKGNVVIPLNYDNTFPFSSGFGVVMKNGKYSYVDYNGKELCEFKYDDCEDFRGDLAIVTIGGLKGFITNHGKELTPLKFTDISPFADDMARVKINNKTGFINTKGEVIIPIEYDEVSDFNNNYANVSIAKKWGVIDKTGKVIVPLEYSDFPEFYLNGYTKVKKGKYFGIIDSAGKIVVPCEYTETDYAFFDGLMLVTKGKKSGFINIKNEAVIPIIYDTAHRFERGEAEVCLKKKCGKAFPDGKVVFN